MLKKDDLVRATRRARVVTTPRNCHESVYVEPGDLAIVTEVHYSHTKGWKNTNYDLQLIRLGVIATGFGTHEMNTLWEKVEITDR